MSKLLPPKLRFGLYVQDPRAAQGKSSLNQYVMCYADSYEVSQSGAITFYQIMASDESKKYKIPVLSYPEGKWDACVLLDDHNEFPVFKGYSHITSSKNDDKNVSEEESNEKQIKSTGHNQNYQSSLNHPSQHVGNNLPGVNNMLSPQEFKKQKEDWIESEIKNFLKDEDHFSINSFLNLITKQPQNRTFKCVESDIEWAASKLIRNKQVMARKFADPLVQKTLSLMLPDIMKRQWDGKMAPILQILQEKEETKNVTAIDLAVWMAQNNY